MNGAVRRSLLVTGPVERLDEWCAAAEAAGWSAVAWPLLRIESGVSTVAVQAHDALVVTSANALPALGPDALRLPRRAAVGERCADQMRVAGGSEPLVADTAEELAQRIGLAWPRGLRLLFPRGDLAAPTSGLLRALGHEVDDPVVYRTVPLDAHAAPATNAVFLASPSAVGAWSQAGRKAGCTIAIGPTTVAALRQARGGAAGDILVLPRPRPAALEELLRGL